MVIFIETGGKDNVITDTRVYTVEFKGGGMGHESRKAKGTILETKKQANGSPADMVSIQ